MRFKTLLLAIVLGAGVAHAPAADAQVVSPLGGSTGNPQRPTTAAPATAAPTASPAAPATATTPHHARKTLAERFADANTTHDGKLTLEQARAGRMRAVVRDFDQIDKTKRGYVTLDDIKSHQADQRAARRAARATTPAATTSSPTTPATTRPAAPAPTH